MKSTRFVSILSLMLILAACSSPAATATTAPAVPTAATYADPFAYCAAVGQVDKPDARYTGELMSDALFKDYLTSAGLDAGTDYPDTFKKMTVWRCMDGKVYACNFGANIPCDSKANTSKDATQAMSDYCAQNPGSDFIPMSVTGHEVIYSWHCVNTKPEILEQIETVDAAGYQSSFWKQLKPNP